MDRLMPQPDGGLVITMPPEDFDLPAMAFHDQAETLMRSIWEFWNGKLPKNIHTEGDEDD